MLNKKKIYQILLSSGIKKDDNILCHSDLSKFTNLNFPIKKLPKIIYESILKIIGKNGTLAVPTFTYSFCKNETFNAKKFQSTCGSFSNYVKNLKSSLIYPDPNVSFAVIGKNKKYLTEYKTINSYGRGSFFDKFYNLNGKLLNINLDITSTYIHFFERKLKVSYRYDKTFCGYICINGKLQRKKSIIFVRKLKDKFKPDTRKLLLKSKKKTIHQNDLYFSTSFIDLKNYFEIIKNNIFKDKYFLVNGK